MTKPRYAVLYHSDKPEHYHGGAFGDGSFIERFSDRAAAEAFASEHEYYGRPSKVHDDDDDDDAAVHCECGEWSGEPCEWSGPEVETVTVEYMPAHHRASHQAAGNRGSYPANGASRICCNELCAERMLTIDPDWVEVQS